MRRWVPFAIAAFMLTPFALWLGLGLFGPGGGSVRIDSPVGAVLLAASLPLAGLFWIQNLRQLGDSIGTASRLRIAERLASLLPPAILGIGGIGVAWLLAAGHGFLGPFLVALATLAMAGFGRLMTCAPVEPGQVAAAAATTDDDGEAAQAALYFLANLGMALLLLAYCWTPWVLFWAVLALIPFALVLMIRLAWWAAQAGVVAHEGLAPPPTAANDGALRVSSRAA